MIRRFCDRCQSEIYEDGLEVIQAKKGIIERMQDAIKNIRCALNGSPAKIPERPFLYKICIREKNRKNRKKSSVSLMKYNGSAIKTESGKTLCFTPGKLEPCPCCGNNELLSPQTVIIVSANNFVIAKGYIIFVKGFRKVSLFNVERVVKILQE